VQFILKRRFVLYMPILAVASGLLFLRTLVYARLLSVEGFGLWTQAMLVANTFTTLASAGLMHLAQKVLPQFHTREEHDNFEDLLTSCVAICGISGALAALLLGLAVGVGWLPPDWVFVAVLPFAIAQYLVTVRLIEIKSELRFIDHAKLSVVRAVLLLVLGVSVAALSGSVAATLIVEAAISLVLSWPLLSGERGRKVLDKLSRLRRDHRWFANFRDAALRLFWLNGVLVALYALDRWFGIALLTHYEYGIFAIGLTIITLFETLQLIVNVSAYPLMSRMIAHGEKHRAFRFATVASVVVIGCGALCYIPFVLMLDMLLRSFLPEFLEASPVIRLAVIVGILRLADFYGTFAILLNRERRLMGGAAVLLGLAFLGITLAQAVGNVRFGPESMMWVSVAIAASVFTLNLGIARFAYRRSGGPSALNSL
jgi:O-antigen/teichoic acid export membrane protein